MFYVPAVRKQGHYLLQVEVQNTGEKPSGNLVFEHGIEGLLSTCEGADERVPAGSQRVYSLKVRNISLPADPGQYLLTVRADCAGNDSPATTSLEIVVEEAP